VAESDNFDWLVPARGSNQQLLLRLYRFAKEHEDALCRDATGRSVFGFLVGASFSLWRAAFLSSDLLRPFVVNPSATVESNLGRVLVQCRLRFQR
jgi:hypothetical protein